MKTAKHKTNVEAVTDIMEFSRFGAVAQMFVIDALMKHAALIAKTKPSDYGAKGSVMLVAPEAWIGVAQEIERKLKEHLQ